MSPTLEPSRAHFEWPTLGLAAAVIAAVLLPGIARWLAVALALYLASVHFDRLKSWGYLEVLVRRGPWVFAAVVTVLLLGELVIGSPPASRDHAIHYFQTWVLVDELLPSGRLLGWSTRLNHGYPFGESYPVLGYMLTGAAYVLSFGVIPLQVSYAWGVLAVWLVTALSVVWLARMVARELLPDYDRAYHDWAGVLALLAWLFDPGAAREGGWNYTMFHGVWPQLLATSLWILTIPLVRRALFEPSFRSVAAAAMCVGASLLAHPFALVMVATSAAAWLIVVPATDLRARVATGWFRTWMLVHVLGVSLAAAWLIRFFASADTMDRSPVMWESLATVVANLIRGVPFRELPGWTGVLGLLGLVCVFMRGRGISWLAAGMLLGLLVLASQASIMLLGLDLWLPAFKNMQFPRFVIAIKPLWFALAGTGGVLLIRTMANMHVRPNNPSRLRSILVCSLVAPLAATAVEEGGGMLARPVGAIDTLDESAHGKVQRELTHALQLERDALEIGHRLRVAFLRIGMRGGTYPIIAVVDAGGALVLDGHIPAVNFEHKLERRNVETLRGLGVTHVIYDRALPDHERGLAGALETVGKYGVYTLARLQGTKPAHQRATIHTPGAHVVVEQRDSEHIELTVENLTVVDAITLMQAPYWRWKAWSNGEPVELELESMRRRALEVTRIPVTAAGTLVVSYWRSASERTLIWISALTWIACVVAVTRTRSISWSPLLAKPNRSTALLLVLACTLALAVIALRRQRAQLEHTWIDWSEAIPQLQDITVSSARDLVVDGSYRARQQPEHGCDPLLGKDVLAGCSEASTRPNMSVLYREPYMYRCLELTIPPGGTARITWKVAEHETLFGAVDRRERRQKSSLRTRLPGHGDAFVLDGLRTFVVLAGEASNVVRLANRGNHPETVCVAGAALRE